MATILVYTANGSEVYPVIPVLQRLQADGHDVVVKTTQSNISNIIAAGLIPENISEKVEFFEFSDWKYDTIEESLLSLVKTFVARIPYEIKDLSASLRKYGPDIVLTKSTCMGACIAAMSKQVPLVAWSNDLIPVPAKDLPTFGLGLSNSRSAFGALRNWAKRGNFDKIFDDVLDDLNNILLQAQLMPLTDINNWFVNLPDLLYFTAEPFEYPRPWPKNVTLVGPNNWEPDNLTELEIASDHRPLILLSMGSFYQNNEQFLEKTLEALPAKNYRLVVTTCSVPPNKFKTNYDEILLTNSSHNHILSQASCLICNGGLELVQKAICHGVPVCIVPKLRTQFELAQRINQADLGVILEYKKLTSNNINSSVSKAMSKKNNVKEMAKIFNKIDNVNLCLEVIYRALREHKTVELTTLVD